MVMSDLFNYLYKCDIIEDEYYHTTTYMICGKIYKRIHGNIFNDNKMVVYIVMNNSKFYQIDTYNDVNLEYSILHDKSFTIQYYKAGSNMKMTKRIQIFYLNNCIQIIKVFNYKLNVIIMYDINSNYEVEYIDKIIKYELDDHITYDIDSDYKVMYINKKNRR